MSILYVINLFLSHLYLQNDKMKKFKFELNNIEEQEKHANMIKFSLNYQVIQEGINKIDILIGNEQEILNDFLQLVKYFENKDEILFKKYKSISQLLCKSINAKLLCLELIDSINYTNNLKKKLYLFNY